MREPKPGKLIKIRRSAEQWQQILERFDNSGLSQEAFCAQESLAMSTFSKWKHKRQDVADTTNSSEKPMFVDLASLANQDKRTAWAIELCLGDGIVLRLTRAQ